jgi:uncharacterized lipoprotein
MTPSRVITIGASLLLLSSIAACGKEDIRVSCDEIQPYQTVVPGKRVVVPEGLDALDEYKEMPIPQSESPPRPKGAACIDYPPPIG